MAENIASLTKKLKELSEQVEGLTNFMVPQALSVDSSTQVIPEPSNDAIKEIHAVIARIAHQTGTSTLLKNTSIKQFEPMQKDMTRYPRG